MVMGGFRLGDIKAGHELEPRYIVLQAPLSVRTDLNRLLQLPIISTNRQDRAAACAWQIQAAENRADHFSQGSALGGICHW